jgi:predicted  nucleic acid-binding Zn-ribbon protein
MSKTSLFIREVTALLKGDDAAATAAKNARKAVSAFDSQIAALRASLVDLENAKEDAEEALKVAKYPTALISNSQYYIRNIVTAQESLDAAVSALEDTQNSLSYFEKLKAEMFE